MPPTDSPSSGATRRDFLKQVAAVTTVAMAASSRAADATTQPIRDSNSPSTQPLPWYRRAVRWGQTNITEADVAHYDIDWWRQHWKRTGVHGVIINAGGIVAYYPSRFPLHHRPPELKDRDLYGELAKAAHDDGIFVLARMDSSKAYEPMYRAHPDWFAVDAAGQPYRSGEYYLSCINSPYYSQWLQDIMREIIERSHPEGIADNIWAGVDRNSICYCQNCAKRFRDAAGADLPQRRDWSDQAYRKWIEWSYARRLEQWDFNNSVTRAAGGRDCLWLGMNGAGIGGQATSFRDLKAICERSEILLLDNQTRSDASGFQENAIAGKLIHGLLGWDKIIPESMAMYQAGRPQFRLSSKPVHEARMWMLAGIAGGIQPWWHHVGAYSEDRRMYQTAEPVMAWHKANERYLINRRPVASVAVGWSQRNQDFFGRDNADELVDQPWRGFTQALVRARIPFVPMHLDLLDRDGADISVLVLANIGAMSDAQIAAVRRFVQRGGALIATGQTSLFNEWGDARPDFALADLLGVHGGKPAEVVPATRRNATAAPPVLHTYLRLTPELRAQSYGPKSGDEPVVSASRHPILAGFDQTDILPFGSTLGPLAVDRGAQVLMTFIPSFPATPPEISYMRQPHTDIPGLVINQTPGGARIAYLAADLDRRFALDNLPDHGDVLANVVRWAAGDSIPLTVTGPGLLNCELYRQDNRLILHIVNLTSAGSWRAPVHELIPVGPIHVAVRWANGAAPSVVRSLVNEGKSSLAAAVEAEWLRFDVPSVLDHEVVVVEA
jgi:hypothetical protein